MLFIATLGDDQIGTLFISFTIESLISVKDGRSGSGGAIFFDALRSVFRVEVES